VRALLGKGGHAWVYECFDRFLNRAVAVKVIKTLREAGRDLSHRAQAEAQVLAAMTHPNLVRVMDAGVMGGLVYIVMEKLDGRTLRHALMALSRLTVPEGLNLAIQIAEGMQVAHDSGVIHRDLKPENIFIESDSHVKVLDFGVAKVLGASPVTTQKDRLQGTVFYMSPEQLQGLAATPASDVFALGTMLYEMLYGHPLLLGGGELPNTEHAAWMQLYKVPPPLETLDQKIPRYVGKLVGRAIVKLPSERFQTMRQFRDAAIAALRRFTSENKQPDEATRPRDLSQSATTPLVAVPDVPAPSIEEPPEPPTQRRPRAPSAAPPPVDKKARVAPAVSEQTMKPHASRRRLPKAHVIAGFLLGVAVIGVLFATRLVLVRSPTAAPVPTQSLPAARAHRATVAEEKPATGVSPVSVPASEPVPAAPPPTAVAQPAARVTSKVTSVLPPAPPPQTVEDPKPAAKVSSHETIF
jgi:serine/threonine-protein kinase